MTKNPVCSRCGVVLKEYATGSLCPRCLLRAGLEAPAMPEPDSAARSTTALSGQRFGDYDLLEEIDHGGMGVVYKARQRSLDRIVAVKLLLSGQFAEPRFVQRFRAEAETVARLQHPNIVAIHEIGEQEGYQFFSMDYIEGRNLAQVRQEFETGSVDFRRCARWVKTMAEAAHYAHQHGIIHRDLKPANVLIDAHDQPHITDFGLAKKLTDSGTSMARSQLTQAGQVLGSPNYLPPEQAAGKPAGVTSDVYSLGAILYHLLTGRPPFEAESLTQVLWQVLETDPVAPRLLNPGIPRDLATITQKCLEKEPARRYQTAQELADEINRFLEDKPILARPAGTAAKVWKWCRRQPALAGLTAGLVLALVSGLTVALWQMQRARRGEALALREAYASDMNQAQRSIEDGNLGATKRWLDKHRPGQRGGTDLRGWEWRYLWSLLRTDEELRLFQQRNPLVNLAPVPDTDLLVLRETGGNIQLWDMAKRQLVGTLPNRGNALAMAVSADGRFVVSANRDDTDQPMVTVWDIGSRQVLRNLAFQTSAIIALALSPDGKYLATFDWEPRVRLWEFESGRMVLELPASEAVNVSQRIPLFSPDGKTLALGEMRGQIRLLDLATRVVREIPSPAVGNGVSALAFSPDSRLLASSHGFSDATIRLWDVATLQLVGNLEGHRSFASKLVFAPDGHLLYSAGSDQSIRIWDIAQRKALGKLLGHRREIGGLALCRDRRTLVSCADDGSVRIWDTHRRLDSRSQAVLPIDVGGIFGLAFTSDGRFITASLTHEVALWDCATGRQTGCIPELGTNNMCLTISPDGRLLVVGAKDGTLKVWDTRAQTIVKEWKAHHLQVFKVCFLKGGKELVSVAMEAHKPTEAKRWDVSSWCEAPFDCLDGKPCYGMAESADRRLVALCLPDRVLTIWDSALDRVRDLSFAGTPVRARVGPAFSPDNRLVSAAVGGDAAIWEVRSGRRMYSLELSGNSVTSTSFSPEGDRLVTGLKSGGDVLPGVFVWDYTVGRAVLNLHSHGNYSGWTGFSPDGTTLVTVGWYGVVDIFHAPSWSEIEAEEKRRK